ncbi:Sec1-like protein [Zopfochytrium polystomum]|nr:Sec1-like protein [Zopfochytrium polystomum]
MRSNLKTILKTRITARLKSVTAKLKVLVADGEATQILLECGCSPNWLADIGYIGQEKLERDRKGISKHDAVYLISPNPPICPAGITEEMFSELRTIQDSIKMLEEFHINFYPAESQIFHLNMPNAIQMLHNPNTDLRDDCISIIASKLLSVFSTLDDFPDIRYYDPKRKRNTLSAKIAERLHENLLELSLHNEKFPTPSSYPGPTTLIIVDRSIDFLAPLMHSLSFQAVVHDFYEVEDRYGLEEKHVV